MPAEFAAHDRTLMAWPARESMWGEHFEAAKAAYAEVANAIAAFEPVTMVAAPSQRKQARAACGGGVTVSELPIDDSWMRDNGPIFVLDGTGAPRRRRLRLQRLGRRSSCPTPTTRR